MFEILFIFVIIYIILKKSNIGLSSSVLPKLYAVLQKNEFTNRKVLVSNNQFTMITADTHGANYLFVIKKGVMQYIKPDIISIYETAQKAHIHNIVIINSLNKPFSVDVRKAMGEYGIEVWDINKLNSMMNVSNVSKVSSKNELNSTTAVVTKSVLKTSNTSDDTCNIDTNSYEPIQENPGKSNGFFKNLFQKPEKL